MFGTGFGDMQVLSARLVMPTASQTFFFALPNGRVVRLIVAWADEDANVTVAREHDGDAWQPEQTLPRSRGLQSVAIVGAENSALLYGEQTISSELVSVKKLYRRGSAGTWYCAKLLPNGFGSELVSDGTGFWFAERVRSQLHVSRFSP